MSILVDTLINQMSWVGLPEPTREFTFAKPRRWRFDLAYPDLKIAIEVEGGIFINGAHTRGKGYEDDLEKYNKATLLGWKLIRVSAGMIKSGDALQTIEKILDQGE